MLKKIRKKNITNAKTEHTNCFLVIAETDLAQKSGNRVCLDVYRNTLRYCYNTVKTIIECINTVINVKLTPDCTHNMHSIPRPAG